MLDRVLAHLQREYDRQDKRKTFELLKDRLTPGATPRHYQQIASELGVTENSVKVAVLMGPC